LRVGVVGGTRLPGNVRLFLSNLWDLLAECDQAFDLELVLSEGSDAPEGYEQVDPGFADTDRAVRTLYTLMSGLTNYAGSRDVDLLFQVTKFPLHGCATAIAGWRTDTPVLTRFAGDNFHEFHLSSGLDAVKAFGLNNVLGRVPTTLSDRVIVLGPHSRAEIERRSRNLPTETIPQAVDFEQFSPVSAARESDLARELDVATDKRVVLTVGRLTRRKGMATVVETARELDRRDESVRWYVLGDGPMRDDLAATPGVEPLGRVPFGEIADYYRVADLVVHPSLIEGLPNVLLEAAACGTPTVARDVGDSATVASATFTEDDELPSLVVDNHDPVTLGDRFDPETLGQRYADAIVRTARER
jgi:glycosyltransferase involved in cell wall biosynthesis